MSEAIEWLKLYMDNHKIGKNVSQEYLDIVDKLIESSIQLQQENTTLKQQLKDRDEKISKVKEYITSYESISTIQSLEFSKDNDGLDEKTMIEMCRRYLIVHDKILKILESE